MNSNCEIISYSFQKDFNEDTFKGLNVFSEDITNKDNNNALNNITTDKGDVISKNKIYFITHTNYTEIDKIEGIININLINMPKNEDEHSDEYDNYFHDITDFIFDQLKLKKDDDKTFIIRDLNTNKIIITNGTFNKIFYKKYYSDYLQEYLYNQFSTTYRHE